MMLIFQKNADARGEEAEGLKIRSQADKREGG